MHLARLRLVGVRPFDDLTIPFTDAERRPRLMCVLYGASGTGKSAIASAIASTRPGYAVALLRPRTGEGGAAPFAVAEWSIGYEEQGRIEPVVISSPNASDPDERSGTLRRREQAAIERRAADGGYVFVCLSGARWFSRTANALATPDRTVLRYDVRAPPAFDDPARWDLSREAKQALSYWTVARALCDSSGRESLRDTFARREAELREVLDALVGDLGFAFAGVDPIRLEPLFRTSRGELVEFDDLPRGLRHVVAFGTLVYRALAAGHRNVASAREAEGVAIVDDIELHQDPHTLRSLAARLRRALPGVQWILMTSSPILAVACDTTELVTFARTSASGPVELHVGTHAIVH